MCSVPYVLSKIFFDLMESKELLLQTLLTDYSIAFTYLVHGDSLVPYGHFVWQRQETLKGFSLN